MVVGLFSSVEPRVGCPGEIEEEDFFPHGNFMGRGKRPENKATFSLLRRRS